MPTVAKHSEYIANEMLDARIENAQLHEMITQFSFSFKCHAVWLPGQSKISNIFSCFLNPPLQTLHLFKVKAFTIFQRHQKLEAKNASTVTKQNDEIRLMYTTHSDDANWSCFTCEKQFD